MENMRFSAEDVLKALKNDLSITEIREFYKGIIAFAIDLEKIDASADERLEEALDYYYETDTISSFINEDLMDKIKEDLF